MLKIIIILFFILKFKEFNEDVYFFDISFFNNNYNDLFLNHFKIKKMKETINKFNELIENKSTYKDQYIFNYDYINDRFKNNHLNEILKSKFNKFFTKYYIHYKINSKLFQKILYKLELNFKNDNKIKVSNKYEFKIENHLKIFLIIIFNIIIWLNFLFHLVEDIEKIEEIMN